MNSIARHPVNLIYARALNGVIGNAGQLPDWRIPGDLKRFKELTSEGVVIMGRKTWQSLPEQSRPLANRVNIIVTSEPAVAISPRVYFVKSPADAYELACEFHKPIWVIGGAEMYKIFEPLADFTYETVVLDSLVQGDTFYTCGRRRRQISEEIVSGVTCRGRITSAVHRVYECLPTEQPNAGAPNTTGQALDEFEDFVASANV